MADRYFLKGGADTLPPQKITSQEVFNSYFGAATVMGEHGRPTAINFSRQYVIAVARPATNVKITLVPKSLVANKKGDVVLTYQEVQGKKRTFTTKPLLLVIVDKQYDGNVVLNKVR